MRSPSDAYYEGVHAARKGHGRERCPYPMERSRLGFAFPSELRREWLQGWRSVSAVAKAA